MDSLDVAAITAAVEGNVTRVIIEVLSQVEEACVTVAGKVPATVDEHSRGVRDGILVVAQMIRETRNAWTLTP